MLYAVVLSRRLILNTFDVTLTRPDHQLQIQNVPAQVAEQVIHDCSLRRISGTSTAYHGLMDSQYAETLGWKEA